MCVKLPLSSDSASIPSTLSSIFLPIIMALLCPSKDAKRFRNGSTSIEGALTLTLSLDISTHPKPILRFDRAFHPPLAADEIMCTTPNSISPSMALICLSKGTMKIRNGGTSTEGALASALSTDNSTLPKTIMHFDSPFRPTFAADEITYKRQIRTSHFYIVKITRQNPTTRNSPRNTQFQNIPSSSRHVQQFWLHQP